MNTYLREDNENASLPQLIGRLTGQLTTLARHEVQLAKAEVRDSLQGMAKHGLLMVLGLLILQAGLLFAIASVGLVLSSTLPAWVAWLAIGVLCAAGGGLLLRFGWSGLKEVDGVTTFPVALKTTKRILKGGSQ